MSLSGAVSTAWQTLSVALGNTSRPTVRPIPFERDMQSFDPKIASAKNFGSLKLSRSATSLNIFVAVKTQVLWVAILGMMTTMVAQQSVIPVVRVKAASKGKSPPHVRRSY
jgi:hypothetical protein